MLFDVAKKSSNDGKDSMKIKKTRSIDGRTKFY